MSSLRVLLSKLSAKKVPAMALVVVGLVGMVAGVLAATITVTPSPFTGEAGTYHSDTGAFTVTDSGLSTVANSASDNSSTAFSIAASNAILSNALTAGHWMDVITFHMNAPAAGTHIATLTFRNGTGPQGSTLETVTSGTWTTTGSSTGTVTFYVDLLSASLTTPVTVYVSVT